MSYINTPKLYSPLVIPKLFKEGYIFSLDGLRALSIFIVLLSHLAHTTNCPDFIKYLMKYTSGNFGVHIFFVLSGFLITGLLLREKVSKGSINLKSFYWRRIVRIFPVFYLYILIIAFICILYQLPITLSEFLFSAIFIQNFTGGPGGAWLLTHSWTLAVEQQFYLLWPLLINIPGRVPYYIGFILLVILWYPFLNTSLYYKPHLSNSLAAPLFRNLPPIMAGSLLSIILYKQWHLNWVTYIKKPIAAYSIFLAWLTYLPSQFHKFGFFSIPFAYMFSSFFIAIFVLHLLLQEKNTIIFKLFNNSIITYIGKISYSLYVWQQLFLIPSYKYTEYNIWWKFYPLNIIATFTVTIICYHFFEKPIFSFKHLSPNR